MPIRENLAVCFKLHVAFGSTYVEYLRTSVRQLYGTGYVDCYAIFKLDTWGHEIRELNWMFCYVSMLLFCSFNVDTASANITTCLFKTVTYKILWEVHEYNDNNNIIWYKYKDYRSRCYKLKNLKKLMND